MATMQEIEVFALVNSDGEYVSHECEDSLNEAYEERIGPMNAAGGLRKVKVTVSVPLPEMIELAGEVNVDEKPGELKVA